MYERERKEMIEQQNDIMVYKDVTGAIFQRKHFKWEETQTEDLHYLFETGVFGESF